MNEKERQTMESAIRNVSLIPCHNPEIELHIWQLTDIARKALKQGNFILAHEMVKKARQKLTSK